MVNSTTARCFLTVEQMIRKVIRSINPKREKKPLPVSKDFETVDEDLLGSYIRYAAHKLDKLTKTRNMGFAGVSNRDNLLDATKTWRQRKFDLTDDILWAEHILRKYDGWSKEKKPIVESYKGETGEKLCDIIKQRRSIRLFENRSVEEEELTKVLEAGRWAPCSGNRQSWKFVVQQMSREAPVVKQEISSKKNRSGRGSVQVYVAIDERLYGEKEKFAAAMDASAAIQNMLLMAHNIGLGACWLYLADLVNQKRLRKILGLEDWYYVYSAILLGYPMEIPETTGRKALNRIVRFLNS